MTSLYTDNLTALIARLREQQTGLYYDGIALYQMLDATPDTEDFNTHIVNAYQNICNTRATLYAAIGSLEQYQKAQHKHA